MARRVHARAPNAARRAHPACLALAALQRSLQEDPFGLAADILVRREGCTAQRCDAFSLFTDPAYVIADEAAARS